MPDIDFIKIEYIFPSGYLHFYLEAFLDALELRISSVSIFQGKHEVLRDLCRHLASVSCDTSGVKDGR